jgi:hypothetical protein
MFLIQSSFGNIGNFEAVIEGAGRIVHYWRANDDPVHPWYKSIEFGNNINSSPALIQSTFGNIGNFEVVVREGNRLRHYWRDNDSPSHPWQTGPLFGDNINSSPALIQSTFGNIGNFEVVVREGNRLRHYWRDNDSPSHPWHTNPLFSDQIINKPSLIQSSFGNHGNFEILTKRGNCLVHFWRSNDAAGFPWSEEIQTHAVVPLGSPPTPAQKSKFLGWFPNLRNFTITAPATGIYNCISWSVGISSEWLWPGDTVAAFDAFYTSYGWTSSASGKREYQKRKVALWADTSGCTHGSRETYDCDWHESKCGPAERIMHDKFQMQDGGYGNIIKYYEKYDPNANLDLA